VYQNRPGSAPDLQPPISRLESVSEVEGQVRQQELDAEAQARRRAALAQLRQYPDPALRLRAHEVGEFDEDLRQLAALMQVLMRDASGVGLAGNQVGVLRRLFVFQPADDEAARTVVNPVIVERSDELATDEEGCLSLGPIRVPVERHLAVTLAGQDVDGDELQLELSDHPARIVQHELDHLDGVLIIDRTTPDARREAMKILRPKPVLV
jgi:peptide deformylase